MIQCRMMHTQQRYKDIARRVRAHSIRLTDYEIFLDRSIYEYGELIEEEMIVESKPNDHNQTMKCEVWKELMKG